MAYLRDDEDRDYEFNARYDDRRERYGDPCPGCGTLRWQGDCPECYREDDDILIEARALGASPLLPADPADRAVFIQDDEVPF